MSRRVSVLTHIKKQRAAKQRRERAERIAEMEQRAIHEPWKSKRPRHLGPIWREKE